MIQIPPSLPEPSNTPRRPEGSNIQAVPAVLADKPGVNPGVVLNLPTPVLETPTDGMKPRDAATQPGATQIDNEVATPAVRVAVGVDADVEVRQGLNTAGLPERLVKLMAQLEQLSDKAGAPVLWPATEQLKASRPEAALLNLRRALGDSMLFEVKRLQTRLVPSAAQSGVAPSDPPASTEPSEFFDRLPESLLEIDPSIQAQPDKDQARPQRGVAGQTLLTNEPAKPLATNVAGKEAPPARAVEEGAEVTRVVPPSVAENDEEKLAASPTIERRAEPLSADSPSIRDAVRLLLHGELRWQGELSPGVFARLQREDAWEEDPHAPGALVKGALVSVDVDLPSLGRVRVRGMFVKDSVRVTVLPDESARNTFQAEFQELRDRLAGRGLEAAQVRLLEKDNG